MGLIQSILEKIGFKKKIKEPEIPPVASRIEEIPKLSEEEGKVQGVKLAKKAKEHARGIHERINSLKKKIIVIGELPSTIREKIKEKRFLKSLKDTSKEIKGISVPKVKEIKENKDK